MALQSCNTKGVDLEQSTEEQINFEEFQNTLIYAISLRNVAENEKLVVWKVNGKYDWASTLNTNFKESKVELKAEHDCESTSAYSFAKCVKKLIDDGKCVKVWSSNGTYYGDVIDCKDDE